MSGATKIDLVVGTRPNFVKMAAIIAAADPSLRKSSGLATGIDYRLIHTGQHYDVAMSKRFFEELKLPNPDVNLEVGSTSHAKQSGAIMTRYEGLLESEIRPEMSVVVGDVNSTLACAITAQKAGIPVAHVEAGLRSGDWSMPEEINRRATDAITNLFFTTSHEATANLVREGVHEDAIVFAGNTMIDTLLSSVDRLRPPDVWTDLSLRPGHYLLLTLHRPSNVDDVDTLRDQLLLLAQSAEGTPIVFPAHPRTASKLASIDLPNNIHVISPQPYLEFMYLVKHASGVVTDSGGLTEETTVLGIPCLTLRTTTERPETVSIGTNELAPNDPREVQSLIQRMLGGEWKKGEVPDRWDGRAGQRVVDGLVAFLSQRAV